MKVWVKVLIWLGLGGGIGFFGGIQVGRRIERKAQEEEREEDQEYYGDTSDEGMTDERVKRVMRVYRGDEDGDEEGAVILPEKTTEWLNRMDAETYPKTDVENQPGGKVPNIPLLHPEDMTGVPITEQEWLNNPEGYDRKELIFYGLDEVVYDEGEERVIENPDTLLGPGCVFGFHGDPNNPIETLYFQNSTMGTIYRLDYVDAAFCDKYFAEGPEDDDPLGDDIDEDDV